MNNILINETLNKLDTIEKVRNQSLHNNKELSDDFLAVLSDVFQYDDDKNKILNRMKACINSELIELKRTK